VRRHNVIESQQFKKVKILLVKSPIEKWGSIEIIIYERKKCMKSQNKVKGLLLILAAAVIMTVGVPSKAATVVLIPNGDGFAINLSRFGASSNWQAAETDDGGTSYVYTTASGYNFDFYTLSDTSLTTYPINSVTVHILVLANGTISQHSAKTSMRIDGASFFGDNETIVGTGWNEFSTEYLQKPAIGVNPATDWTWIDINNLQAGVSLRRAGTGIESRCTRVWIVVDYTVPNASISGAKFYDADTDGVWDAEEPAIEGWMIGMYDDEEALLDMQFTDENGEYLFDELDPGTYTVKEIMPPGETILNGITYPTWLNTTDDSITIEDLSGPSENNNFGNVCIGCDGGANGKGWWTNNGADDGTDDLGALCTLNLRDENGDDFDPTIYGIKVMGKFPEGTFAYWLQEADAVNMAYMLSAQLAAMELDVLNGFVDDEALVYAPGTDSANASGFASISDLMSEANTELGTHGTALSGDDWRDYQEALKNALDAANNNVNFVCPEPCLPIVYPIL